MADLKPAEVEKAKLHFDIYDFEGCGSVDAFHLGDLLRSLDLVPTQAAVFKLGGAKKLGEKKIALEEFLPIYSQMRKDKDVGTYEDFMECMKVYDKMDNGMMMEAELSHLFMALGEKLTDEQVDDIMKDITAGQTPDEDGNVKYDMLLKKLLAGPFPEENKEEKK